MLKQLFLMAVLGSCVNVSQTVGQMPSDKSCGEHISITVTGEAKGKPEFLVLELVSEATAGNAIDALSQCKSKADAASEAIAALNIQGAQVIREMYQFSSPTAVSPYGMTQLASAPAGTRASQVIRFKASLALVSDIGPLATTISKVLDAANRAGVGFKQAPAWQTEISGPGTVSAVKYVLEDASALRLEAIDDCLNRVREIKSVFSTSGVDPGELVGIAYEQVDTSGMTAPWAIAGPMPDSATSTSPTEVSVRASLTLRFRFRK